MSCPVLRSFTFLSFGNKFSSKITKTSLQAGSSVEMACGRNIGASVEEPGMQATFVIFFLSPSKC